MTPFNYTIWFQASASKRKGNHPKCHAAGPGMAGFGLSNRFNRLRIEANTIASHGVDFMAQSLGPRRHVRCELDQAPHGMQAITGLFEFSNRADQALYMMRHHRFSRFKHVEFRVEFAGNALDNNHCLLQQQQLWLGFHIEQICYFKQQR